MQCYKCNYIYNDYLEYCPYCGVKKEDFNVCSSCEEKLTKDILICPVCGAKAIEETDEMKSDRLNREGLKHTRSVRAEDYFNEAIRFNKYNVDAWVNKAENLNNITLHKASRCCDAGLKINKDNIKLLLVKAKALKKDGDDKAKIIFNNLLKRCNCNLCENEIDEDVWIVKGEVLCELDDNKKSAIECYSKALEINPENEELWISKAFLCRLDRDYIGQIECYKKALKLNPDNDEYYKEIGDTYSGYIHDNEKAIGYYNKALQLNPHCYNGYLWNEKGRLETEMEKYDDALKSYTTLLELHPDYDNALRSMAEIFCRLNRFEKAIECYDEALKISSNGYTQSLKAKVLIESGRYEDALEVYEESINDSPDYDETYLLKGDLLHKLGRFEDEIRCYDILLNKDDYDYDLYKKAQLKKAVSLSKVDKEKSEDYFKELLDDCNISLKIFPDDCEYMERKADILYFSGNLKEAYECYDKTLKCGNLNKPELIIASKAKILYDLRDYQKAIRYFDEALEISNFSWGLKYKGYCLEELGRYGEAMKCYNKCLEIDSRNEEVKVKKSELSKKIG